MTKLEELNWKNHWLYLKVERALVKFNNNYALSILRTDLPKSNAYCDENTYEVGLMKDNKFVSGNPVPVFGKNPKGYLSEKEVLKLIEEVEKY